MLSSLWTLVSSHPIGSIAAVIAVVLIFIDLIIKDDDGDWFNILVVFKTVMTVIVAVAFLGTKTGHPVIVGVIAFFVAGFVFLWTTGTDYGGDSSTSSRYSSSRYSSSSTIDREYYSSSSFDSYDTTGSSRLTDEDHDELDMLRRAMHITEIYGEDWKGYDPEASTGYDPEAPTDSKDIW
ncbi:MAG: hypothetical protein J1E35_08215 [Lachnospiraceae bacterium]|nr:hypothetical protein [Lachnospiraceae bacterium]